MTAPHLLPRSAQGALRRFARDHVDLRTDEVAAARRSRDYLIQQLQNGAGEFPPFTGEVRHFGSFARRTKIRPLDDIDLMVVLEGQGLTLAHTDGQGTHFMSQAGTPFLIRMGSQASPNQQARYFFRPTKAVSQIWPVRALCSKTERYPRHRSLHRKNQFRASST